MTKTCIVENLAKVYILLLCHRLSAGSSTQFTSSPSSIIKSNIGENITLKWQFSLTTSDKDNFQEVALGIKSATDNSFIKLVSVSRIGSASTPTLPVEAAAFKGRTFFVGNASLARLAEFMLSDIRTTDNNQGFLCSMKLQNIYIYSNESVVSIGAEPTSAMTTSPLSSDSDDGIYIGIGVASAVLAFLIGAAVFYVWKEKYRQNVITPRCAQVQPAPDIR